MMKTRNQVLILAVVFAVLGTGSAWAAMTAQHAADNNFNFPSAGSATLWSQLDDPSGSAFSDQAFEAVYAAYDATGGDDFDVTDASGWDVDTINAPGSQLILGSNPFFVNHAFYGDGGGQPGSVICDFPANTNFTSDGTGDISATVACNVPSGTAWVSQSVREDFNPFGQHFWATRASSNGSEGVWRNPGNGFGSGCIDWSPMNTTCGTTGSDWMFELLGDIRPISEGVPAVGPFGVALLVLALGGGSTYVLRRRRA